MSIKNSFQMVRASGITLQRSHFHPLLYLILQQISMFPSDFLPYLSFNPSPTDGTNTISFNPSPFEVHLPMDPGVACSDIECGHSTREWMNARQDPIVGIDQTAAMFWKEVVRPFQFSQTKNASEKQYDSRKYRPIKANFESIAGTSVSSKRRGVWCVFLNFPATRPGIFLSPMTTVLITYRTW